MVKLMRSLFIARMAKAMDRFLFRNALSSLVVGIVFTVLVQSSSVTTSLVVPLVGAGILTLEQIFPYTLGANIGTTVTAFLASLPMGTSARRAARAHMVFNLFGVLWMLSVYYPFTRLVDLIMPGSVDDPQAIPLHLSLFHTMFNVTNTIILVPFVGGIARLVEYLVPERRRVVATGAYRLALVSPNLPDALDSNLITIRGELSRMSSRAVGMLQSVMDASRDPTQLADVRTRLETTEQYVDDMQ
jgi:phosphate:Na+ symporter